MDFFKYLFDPNSIAVIGASNTPGTWGFGVMDSLLTSPKKRKVWPVTKRASDVLGLKAYRSITEIPEVVDFAVLAIPFSELPGVMKECVVKGVKAALIISGGLSEVSEDGERIEREVFQIAREGKLRFIGPNSMGHSDTSTGFSTLAWLREIKKGAIGFISQSGTYGQRLVRTSLAYGQGFSKFVSSGNEADLHLEDYLEYLAQDEETKIIALYMEGLREKRRFFHLAREITKKKPIIVLKSGSTESSARAAKSHVAALSGSDAVFDAAFRQAGVIRVEDDDELFDTIIALHHLPLPRGRKVGILTEGGGIGVMAAEACEKVGLEVPSLSPSTIERLNAFLPPYWSHGNPADMTDVVTAGKLVTFSAFQAVIEDENVDMVMLLGGLGAGLYFRLFLSSSPYMKKGEEMEKLISYLEEKEKNGLRSIKEQIEKLRKPVVVVKLIPEVVTEPEAFSLLRRLGVPVYPNPQRAAKALAHLVWYREYVNPKWIESPLKQV